MNTADNTALLVIAVWALGTSAVIGAPFVVYGLWSRGWIPLPDSGALTKGPGPSPLLVDEALLAFREAWRVFSGRDFDTDRFLVEWRRGERFTLPGVYDHQGALLMMKGRMRAPRSIVVARRSSKTPIGHTTFFHELMHAALAQQGVGVHDVDHESWTSAHWAFVEQLKEKHR